MNEFAQDQVSDLILAPFWIALVIIISLALIAGAFGFFHVLGGPYGFARFFFWIFALITVLIILGMRAVLKRSKKIIKSGISSARNIINN